MDITASFNELLQQRDAPTTKSQVTLDVIDGFLKEAYRIVSPVLLAPSSS